MSVRTYDPRMGHHTVRRVVTGIDASGDHVITSDGPAPNSIDAGPIGVSEVFWSATADRCRGDDPDRSGEGFPLEPPLGGVSGRVIRMPGIPTGVDPDDTWLRVDGDDPTVPGMHATDTLDLMVVLEGSVVMGLDDDERVIGPGEFVVQRGTRHRWRPADEHGWTYFVAMFRPGHCGIGTGTTPPSTGTRPVRRVVTGSPTIDGGASEALEIGSTIMTDIWHTGGPLASTTQGGDPTGPWSLEPVEGGAWFRLVELAPAPPIEGGWHVTASVDIDIVISGRVLLELPGGSTELGPGDVIVQRGTDHRWSALGEETFRMASVMISARP
jgi:quercetin dioxygenase-like cupin family protein